MTLLVKTTNNTYLNLDIDNFVTRVYHKSHLMVLSIWMHDLLALLKSRDMEFEALIVKISR